MARLDEFVALAVCAAVTERIGLMTNIALLPTWDAARFAKVTASLDQLSNGRLTLGLAVGSRPDDFEATGRDMTTRGRTFDEALEVLHESWQGKPVEGFAEPFGPPTVHGRIPLLFGGDAERAGAVGAAVVPLESQ